MICLSHSTCHTQPDVYSNALHVNALPRLITPAVVFVDIAFAAYIPRPNVLLLSPRLPQPDVLQQNHEGAFCDMCFYVQHSKHV